MTQGQPPPFPETLYLVCKMGAAARSSGGGQCQLCAGSRDSPGGRGPGLGGVARAGARRSRLRGRSLPAVGLRAWLLGGVPV